jgi:hypothetical protein
MTEAAAPKRDFFISFNQSDRLWARWIAWELEEAGYSVWFQDWDFRGNFVERMERAHAQSDRTLAVLSDHYFASDFTRAEWSARFVEDPAAREDRLVPIKVGPLKAEAESILRPMVHADLSDCQENAARELLLGRVKKAVDPSYRDKPMARPGFPPRFPGFPSRGAIQAAIRFPIESNLGAPGPDTQHTGPPDRPPSAWVNVCNEISSRLGIPILVVFALGLVSRSSAGWVPSPLGVSIGLVMGFVAAGAFGVLLYLALGPETEKTVVAMLTLIAAAFVTFLVILLGVPLISYLALHPQDQDNFNNNYVVSCTTAFFVTIIYGIRNTPLNFGRIIASP